MITAIPHIGPLAGIYLPVTGLSGSVPVPPVGTGVFNSVFSNQFA